MPNYTVACPKCRKSREVYRTLAEHGQWPSCHGQIMQQVFHAPQLVHDIQPYQAVAVDIATGKPPRIGSRRQHKEFLRRNQYVEVGNEPIRKQPIVDVPSSRADIQRTIHQMKADGRWK